MKQRIFKFLVPTFLTFFCYPAYTQQTATDTLAFNWAFVYKQQDGLLKSWDEQQPVTRVAAGDRIKFFLQPVKNAYLYLYLYDSQKKLFLLFPGHNRFFDTAYRQTGEYFVPEGKVWLSVNPDQGVENFYLLASGKRLTQLENLTASYLTLSDSAEATGAQINQAMQTVLDEIRHIKKRYSIFQGLVEKPVIIAGDYRGEKDLRSFIKGIEVDSFYTKTIRLAH